MTQRAPDVIGPAAPEEQIHEVAGIRFQWADDIRPNYLEPGLIDGILDDVASTIVYGPSGSGKTALVVDLVCRVAAGMDWRGRETKQGAVLYFAAENAESTRRRIWVWRKHNGIRERLPLAVAQSPIQVDGAAADNVIKAAKAVEKATGMPVRLVVFDTLARTMKGDENTVQDTGVFIRATDRIKDELKCNVMVVHHTGHGDQSRARGSSNLRASADHELEVQKERSAQVGAVTLTKVREGDMEGARFGFKMVPVRMGMNRLGREVTSPVVEECEAPERKGSGHEELVQDVTAYVRAQGRVTVEELQAEFGALSKGKPESDKRAWARFMSKHFKGLPGALWALRQEPDRSGQDGQP